MDKDHSKLLQENVAQALRDKQSLTIAGMGSKSFLLPPPSSERSRMLSVSEHQGVVEYRADELVLTARSGTSLKLIRSLLSQQQQMLPFEPPEYRGRGTLGGALASGLAGPARPWRGAVRDAVLGVQMINGLGEMLQFGGKVVKNVAGYDVSRLQAGAFGTLGVLLQVSLRLLPLPPARQTRVLTLNAADAVELMRRLARRALPLTGACHVAGQLYLRLEGAEAAVLAAAADIGGEASADTSFWSRLNNHELEFFAQPGVLMRQQLPPAEAVVKDWNGLIDWAGGRRWFFLSAASDQTATDHPAGSNKSTSATPFDHRYAINMCRDAGGDALLGDYQARIRAAFDPHSLFNPELSHADFAA